MKQWGIWVVVVVEDLRTKGEGGEGIKKGEGEQDMKQIIMIERKAKGLYNGDNGGGGGEYGIMANEWGC